MYKTKMILTLIFSFFLISFNQNISAQNNSKEKDDNTRLEEILKKTMEYCSRLENLAFYFVCLEEISEKIDHSRDMVKKLIVRRNLDRISYSYEATKKIEKNKYLYDYQLIRKENKIEERRILLEENGEKKNEKDATLKTIMFHYEKILFGPMGLLSKFWQPYHDYQIVKEEILDGEKTSVIKAIPWQTLKQNYLYGKAWVREKDFSIVKIEWNQRSIGSFQTINEIAKKYKAEPSITIISEFNIEKNGIRFPNNFFIEEAYINEKGKKFIRSETMVIYKNYKFFTVETEIKH